IVTRLSSASPAPPPERSTLARSTLARRRSGFGLALGLDEPRPDVAVRPPDSPRGEEAEAASSPRATTGVSRTQSSGRLSSRSPRKAGCRMPPSPVPSVNRTSPPLPRAGGRPPGGGRAPAGRGARERRAPARGGGVFLADRPRPPPGEPGAAFRDVDHPPPREGPRVHRPKTRPRPGGYGVPADHE